MSVELLLEQLAAQIHQAVREEAARHSLLPVQLQVLSFLANANNYSDFALPVSEYLGLTRGTVSQTLSVLERDGFITKRADDLHGRRMHLDLTAKARKVVNGSWNTKVAKQLQLTGGAEPNHSIKVMLDAFQLLNQTNGFGVCQTCDHFQKRGVAGTCGLTGDPLAAPQITKLCREWTNEARSASDSTA